MTYTNDATAAAERLAAIGDLEGLTPAARRRSAREVAAAAADLLDFLGGACDRVAAAVEDGGDADLFAALDTCGELSCGLSAGAALREAAWKLRAAGDDGRYPMT